MSRIDTRRYFGACSAALGTITLNQHLPESVMGAFIGAAFLSAGAALLATRDDGPDVVPAQVIRLLDGERFKASLARSPHRNGAYCKECGEWTAPDKVRAMVDAGVVCDRDDCIFTHARGDA